MRLFSLIFTAMFLVACSQVPDMPTTPSAALKPNYMTSVAPKKKSPPPSFNQGPMPRVDSLDEQNLPAGSCGILLWTLNGQEAHQIFRYVTGSDAWMRLDGKSIQLSQLTASQYNKFGVPLEASFEGGALQIEYVATSGASFKNGQYVQRGTLRIAKSDGWVKIVPVAGLTGCRP